MLKRMLIGGLLAMCVAQAFAAVPITNDGKGDITRNEIERVLTPAERPSFTPAAVVSFKLTATTKYNVKCGPTEVTPLVNVVSTAMPHVVDYHGNGTYAGYSLTGFGSETEVNPVPSVGDACTLANSSPSTVTAVTLVKVNNHTETDFALLFVYAGVDRPLQLRRCPACGN